MPVNLWALNKVAQLPLWQSIKLVSPSVIGSLVMAGMVVWLQQHFNETTWLNLGILSVAGALTYLIVYSMLHHKWLGDLKAFLRNG